MISTHIKAVIFDIGGVVMRSPLLAIAAFEEEMGLPRNYINCAIARRGQNGAWQRFERGEMDIFSFYDTFGRELCDTDSCNQWYTEYCKLRNIGNLASSDRASYFERTNLSCLITACLNLPESLQIDGRDLFGRMMRESTVYDENIVEAIRRIRAADRWRIVALTNNFSKAEEALLRPDGGSMPSRGHYLGFNADEERAFLGWTDGATPPRLRALFHDFCDSSTLGKSKPDPEFYLLACKRNSVLPSECVFLDDLGVNLKTARELGMKTIHVPIGGSLAAIRELEKVLGIDLMDPRADSRL